MIQFIVQYRSENGQTGFAKNLKKIYTNIETIDKYCKTNLKGKLDENKGFEEVLEIGKFVVFLGVLYTEKNERYGIMNFNSVELGEDYFYRLNKVDGRYIKDRANDKTMAAFYKITEKINSISTDVELLFEPDDNLS